MNISQDNLDRIIELRRLLHSCPDLSLNEYGTIRILQEFLQENTSLKIVDMDGWFYAVAEAGDAEPIAFRAELDALPMDECISLPYASGNAGVSHKCGHDGHMAALCGLALELENTEVDRTVYLIFQPAEETEQGAVLCADLIHEKGIDEIYAFHNLSAYPEGSIVYRKNLTQPASEGVMIRMHGKQSHASAPEEGSSPAMAIAELALFACGLADNSPAGMALCTIVGMECGDGDFGISPGEGSINVTLRAEEESFMKEMESKFLNKAEELAAQYNLHTEHEIHDYFPETRNNDEALQKIIRKATEIGLSVIEMEELWRASEDFGHFLKICPGAIFYIGNGNDYPALHTGNYDFNDRILETAINMFLALC